MVSRQLKKSQLLAQPPLPGLKELAALEYQKKKMAGVVVSLPNKKILATFPDWNRIPEILEGKSSEIAYHQKLHPAKFRRKPVQRTAINDKYDYEELMQLKRVVIDCMRAKPEPHQPALNFLQYVANLGLFTMADHNFNMLKKAVTIGNKEVLEIVWKSGVFDLAELRDALSPLPLNKDCIWAIRAFHELKIPLMVNERFTNEYFKNSHYLNPFFESIRLKRFDNFKEFLDAKIPHVDLIDEILNNPEIYEFLDYDVSYENKFKPLLKAYAAMGLHDELKKEKLASTIKKEVSLMPTPSSVLVPAENDSKLSKMRI